MKKTHQMEFPFVVDKPTMNGRIYPRAVMEKAIKDVQQTIRDRRMFGELNSCESRVKLTNVSHVVTAMSLVGDRVVATIEVLPTVRGKVLAKLLDAKIPLGLLPIGFGNVEKDTNVISSDYRISSVHVNKKHDE